MQEQRRVMNVRLENSSSIQVKHRKVKFKDTWPLHLMLLPGNILMAIFGTYVLAIGVIVAFKKYKPAKGILASKWAGWSNFEYMFMLPDSFNVFRNTLVMAVGKILLTQFLALLFALLLNEVRSKKYQKLVQTAVYPCRSR